MLSENRDSSWQPRNHSRIDFEFPGILERDGGANDIFENKVEASSFSVSSGDYDRADERGLCCVCGDASAGCTWFPVGKGLSAERD